MIKAAYTIHQETEDGTLQPAFHAAQSKRAALALAKRCAKGVHIDVTRFVVCDAEGQTVATVKSAHV